MNRRGNALSLPIWLLWISLSGVALALASPVTLAAAAAEEGAEQVLEQKSSDESATAPESAIVPEQDTGEATAQAPGENKPGKKAEESPDVFNPSEEISEDFAVAFPVDI